MATEYAVDAKSPAAGGEPIAASRPWFVSLIHRSPVAPIIVGIIGLLIVAILANNGPWLGATALLVVFALATVGLNFAQGAAGMFTMGTAAFVGVGGYTTGYLTTSHHWSGIAAMAAGVGISLVVGSGFALLTLRVNEIYLAIATLALVQIFGGLVLAYPKITHGVDGIPVIPPLNILGFKADTLVKTALLNVIILTVLAVLASIILRSRPGRSLRAIREDHLAASGAGVRVNRSLNLAFVLSATYASVAGSLYAHTIAFVDPTAFTLDLSVSTIAMLVIGGSGSVVGAIIGAALLQYATQYLRSYQAYSSVLYGLVILFGALVSPVGIVGGFHLLAVRTRLTRRLFLPPPVARPPVEQRATAAREKRAHAPLHDTAATTAAKTDILQAIDIAKAFGGVKALRGVSLTVEPGQIHALIGPNGSGKTTFINVLSGIFRADTGTVSIGERRIDRLPIAARSTTGLARTYQNGRLFRALPVHENITIAGDHRSKVPGVLGQRYPGLEGPDWVELIIDLVGIAQLEAAPAVTLGFGNQRRVELARALALDPTFLLLDEPAAGLSATEKTALTDLLGVFRGLGMGILLVEHSMDVVMGIADVLTVLDFGQIIGHGSPAEIRADHKVIDAYLGVA